MSVLRWQGIDDVPLAGDHYVQCVECNIERTGSTEVEASAAWNRRPLSQPPEASEVEAVRDALNGYRAAVSWISADSWDGCSDCIAILRKARTADWQWDWAGDPQRIALELKELHARLGDAAHPPKASPMQEGAGYFHPAEFVAKVERLYQRGLIDQQARDMLQAGLFTQHPKPIATSPMQELQNLGQEFDAGVEASEGVTGEMLKAALLEEGGDAYMRNEDTPSHFLIDGIVDLDAVARSLAQPAPEQGEG